jgi:hypothetical protein
MPFLQATTDMGKPYMLEWSPNAVCKPKFKFKRLPLPAAPITLEEEVVAGVKTWYANLGKPVPKEDLDACSGINAEQIKIHEAEMAKPPSTKLVYGTPEFWKDWWAKKKAKEAKEASAQQTPSVQVSAKPTWLASRKKTGQPPPDSKDTSQ